MEKIIIFFCILVLAACHSGQEGAGIITGAGQPDKYLLLLKGKHVGLVANHTSLVSGSHLLDFLVSEGINVVKIFAPEHGFRGEAAAGENIADSVDKKTGVEIVSIYGGNEKPTKEQLGGVGVMVFDIQDVGCRFYTYISTLHYIIEACSENNIPLIVLDRPNPNGDYVAGPVLEKEYLSFVGMDPVPVVHGCTVGELALMIDGEGWHDGGQKCKITVIPVKGYEHTSEYSLPVAPSPNLPNDLSVRLYPSLCFFEATSVSIGRGTEFPFQVIGYPDERFGSFAFTPEEIPGVALSPKQEGKICYGEDLRQLDTIPKFTLTYFLKYYRKFDDEAEFLTRERWLALLSGSGKLIQMIRSGKSESEIVEAWKTGLEKYKRIRKKYLLYPDFE